VRTAFLDKNNPPSRARTIWNRLPSCAALGAWLLGGCAAVGPDHVAPSLPVPESWHRIDPSGRTSTQTAVDPGHTNVTDLARWWLILSDPALSGLIEETLRVSPDVRIAQARLREARARRALAHADLFPSATATGSISTSKGSRETGSGRRVELYQVGFDAAWEPDIFGGQRRALEAAQAGLEQSAAELDATHVSLGAEAALSYVDLRAFQARLDVARRNLATQAETLQLTDWRAQAGLASALEVEQARTVFEQTRALIPVLETGLAQTQDRIAFLLARPPAALNEDLLRQGPVPTVSERVAVGIPADTLRRRPDVRAAERGLAAETARIGQVEAARLPSLRLSGSIGLEALGFGALSSSGALARSLLASVSGVLFDAGRIRRQVEIQEAVRDQTLVAYQRAVLTALQEVEDALVALAKSAERESAASAAAESARNAALYARQRYTSGLIDFQAVLDTQRTVLVAEEGLVNARADSASSFIRLYKALGGGWTPGAAEASLAGLAAR
jgi:NodT family efflux transporter outer membrane factor (OMF) lipoprotein